MWDYFHASDLQAALAALINVQESFHKMYRICTDSITEQRRICNHLYQILDAPIRWRRPRQRWTRPGRSSRWWITLSNSTDFCVTVCTQISSQKRLSKRRIKSEDAKPLLRLLFTPSSCKRSRKQHSNVQCVTFVSTTCLLIPPNDQVIMTCLHLCSHNK